MTTDHIVTVKTSGGDYSTVEAAVAAANAYNCVGNDQRFRIDIDSAGGGTSGYWEFATGSADWLTFNNTNTDATRYIWLRAADGKSFQDDVGIQGNALRVRTGFATLYFNASVGGLYAFVMAAGTYVFLDRLQILIAGTGTINVDAATGMIAIRDCIFEAGSSRLLHKVSGTSGCRANLHNVVAYPIDQVVGPNVISGDNFTMMDSTFYGNGSSNVFGGDGTGAPISMISSIFAGFPAFGSVGYAVAGLNATDLGSAPGGGNVLSQTITNLVNNVSGGTQDFRLKAGNTTIDNEGELHTGTEQNLVTMRCNGKDIKGATRGASPTIGAWDIATLNLSAYYYLGADIAAGGWTPVPAGGSLFARVNETIRDDANYIQSMLNPITDLVELQWLNVQPPNATTGHTVSYVLAGDASTNVTVKLIAGDGTTVIHTWTHSPVPSTPTQFDQTLTTGEAATWGTVGYPGSRLRLTAG